MPMSACHPRVFKPGSDGCQVTALQGRHIMVVDDLHPEDFMLIVWKKDGKV